MHGAIGGIPARLPGKSCDVSHSSVGNRIGLVRGQELERTGRIMYLREVVRPQVVSDSRDHQRNTTVSNQQGLTHLM